MGLIKVPLKSALIIIIYKRQDLHWQWPMQVCYLRTFFTAPVGVFLQPLFYKNYLFLIPATILKIINIPKFAATTLAPAGIENA